MKIASTFIVKIEDRFQVLYALENDTFYICNGSFLTEIKKEEVNTLLEGFTTYK